MFGRATIRLGIDPRSSFDVFSQCVPRPVRRTRLSSVTWPDAPIFGVFLVGPVRLWLFGSVRLEQALALPVCPDLSV